MIEKSQISAKRQSGMQLSHISDDTMENNYDDILNLIIEFAMMLYMEDKLEQILKNRNIEKKWNEKLTRNINRYLEELNV
jgi:hypothetical protein